jgi:hypothetical protein
MKTTTPKPQREYTPLQCFKKFFPDLYKSESRAAWVVFLKAAFAEPLTPTEKKTYESCTGRTTEFVEEVREIWLICGRRAGKSEITAFLAIYLACFRKYKLTPGRGGKIYGLLLAADREQAGVLMTYISEMLHSHTMLESFIAKRGERFRETQRSIVLTNGLVIRVATSNFRRVRGYTVAFVLCDEIAFWENENAANPDKEVLNALRPALGTTRGKLIALSSPYAMKGELYTNYREHYGKDGDPVMVWKAATRVMNPSFPQEDVDRAYKEDHQVADAEYGANFRSDVKSLFDPAIIEALINPANERPRQSGVQYRAFVDPAGGSGKDSMTLAIAHTETLKVEGKDDLQIEVLDCLREVPPPFNPDDTARDFCDVIKSYGCSSVTGDRFGGEWPRERFRVHGIEYLISERTKQEIYKDLLPLANANRVDLLADPKLKAQLLDLERRTGRAGRDTIDHPRGKHDDVANAAAGALVMSEGGIQYRCRLPMAA